MIFVSLATLLFLATAVDLSNCQARCTLPVPQVPGAKVYRFDHRSQMIEIPQTQNAQNSGLTFRESEGIRYICSAGSVTAESPMAVCRRSGQWSTPKITCRAGIRAITRSACGAPPPITNGQCRVDSQGTGEYSNGVYYNRQKRQATGIQATCSCKSGYSLSHNRKVTCQPNGQWGPLPSCRATTNSGCGQMPEIPNGSCSTIAGGEYNNGLGRRNWRNRRRNRRSMRCSCRQGFSLSGSNQISCTNGRWSALPTCAPVTCGQLPFVHNGNCALMNDDGEYNQGSLVLRIASPGGLDDGQQKASCTCNNGYTLTGSSVISCSTSGAWSQEPRCVSGNSGSGPPPSGGNFFCASPPQIDNGECYQAQPNERETDPMTRSGPSDNFDNWLFRPGQKVRYRCNEGYEIDGTSIAMCSSDGRWLSVPKCVRKVVTCGPPPNVEGAGCPACRRSFVFNENDRIRYSCNFGYRMDGPAVITCQQDGEWSTPPTCVLVGTTTSPSLNPTCTKPTITNGECEITGLSTDGLLETECYCNADFQMIGNKAAHCVSSGNWQALPQCTPVEEEEITCPYPPNVNGAGCRECANKPIDTSIIFYEGDQIVYQCRSNFQMNGNPVITCLNTGQWSEAPTCIRKRGRSGRGSLLIP